MTEQVLPFCRTIPRTYPEGIALHGSRRRACLPSLRRDVSHGARCCVGWKSVPLSSPAHPSRGRQRPTEAPVVDYRRARWLACCNRKNAADDSSEDACASHSTCLRSAHCFAVFREYSCEY